MRHRFKNVGSGLMYLWPSDAFSLEIPAEAARLNNGSWFTRINR